MTHLNINNIFFEQIFDMIYPKDIQLNKTNTSDTETKFLDLKASISNDIISTKIYNKLDN